MYAGHLPTKHFGQAEWQAMPVWAPKVDGECPPDGFHRGTYRQQSKYCGKPIVVYVAPLDSGEVSYAVRPIVRVPMRKAG